MTRRFRLITMFFLLSACVLGAFRVPAPASAMDQIQKEMDKHNPPAVSVDAPEDDKTIHLIPHVERWESLREKFIETGIVVVLGYLLIFLLVRITNRTILEIKVRHAVRKNIAYIVNGLLVVLIMFIWIQDLSSISIFLGLLSAGVAMALQEVFLCIAGWMLILTRRPFEAGDRIELGGIKGDVIDIRMFQTSLLEIGNWVTADQSTGRVVNIPNSAVFKKENYNYSRGFEFIWNELRILLTFESDWKKGKDIVMRHASKLSEGMDDRVQRQIKAMANRYMIYYGKLTPIVYVDIKDSGVELALRYLTEAKRRRATNDQLCQAILEDFDKEPDVNFAYPTYRIVKE